jgi:hypothetical protein
MLQLNPPLPVLTAKGRGYAYVVQDYSQDHDTVFLVGDNATGELWWVPQYELRLQENVSFGREYNAAEVQQLLRAHCFHP